MKKDKLYIETKKRRVTHLGGKRVRYSVSSTLICANNIPILEPYLPTNKQLRDHMIYEKRACELARKGELGYELAERKPNPLLIRLEFSIFITVLQALTLKGYDGSPDRIDLVLQSGNAPICSIVVKD